MPIIIHNQDGTAVENPDLVADGPLKGALWVDVLDPQGDERTRIEEALGFSLPSRQEMHEIEHSSRLYLREGRLYMTASILFQTLSDHPETRAVTFILDHDRLVTMRFITPRSFGLFRERLEQEPHHLKSAEDCLAGLLDSVVDRIADVLEEIDAGINLISHRIFAAPRQQPGNTRPGTGKAGKGKVGAPLQTDLQSELREVERSAYRLSKVTESLVGLTRLFTFLNAHPTKAAGRTSKLAMKSVQRDVQSLRSQATHLTERVTFLLDATLGMINIEQTAIIKIISVMSVIFLPPTVIASLYGMNFVVMPELKWAWGYPFAIVLMILSAVLPYKIFKRKGWL